MKTLPAILAAFLGLLIAAGGARSELTQQPALPPAELTEIVPAGAVSLRCWQQGMRIIDEIGLGGSALGLAAEPNTLRFVRRETGGTVLLMSPGAETLCLVEGQLAR